MKNIVAIKKENCNKKISDMLKIFLAFALYIAFALYFGVIPKFTINGWGANLSRIRKYDCSNMFHADCILYPLGQNVNEGYIFPLLNTIISILPINSASVVTLSYLILYTISFVSIVVLVYKKKKNCLLCYYSIIIFYLNPFLLANQGLDVILFGIMLMPFVLLMDIYAINVKYNNKLELLVKLIIVFLSRLLVISVGWYTGLLSAIMSCLSLLVYYLIKVWKEKKYKHIINYFFIVVFPWMLAMIIIVMLMPRGTTSLATKNLDFFNGNSVSLLTLFLPNNNQLISNILPSVDSFLTKGYGLSGDSSMWSNYLGYSTLILAIIGLYNAKKNNNSRVLGVAIAGIVCFIMSMGPGLKILGQVKEELIGTYNGYLYSMDNVISFPWKNIFLIFPFSMMRAVYRWQVIFIIALWVLSINGIITLIDKNIKCRYIAVLLGIVAVVEFCPKQSFASCIDEKIQLKEELCEYTNEVVNPLKNVIGENDLIAISSYGESNNGFMLSYLMSELGADTYAGCGDKAIELNKSFIPENINIIQNSSEPEKIAAAIDRACEQRLCNGVLLPFFRIRSESHYWPWSKDTIIKYKMLALDIIDNLNLTYNIYETDYAIYIEFANIEENINNLIDIGGDVVKDTDKLYRNDFHIETKNNPIDIEISLDNNENIFYMGVCISEKENIEESGINITYYDINHDEISRSNNIWEFEPTYTFREAEFLIEEDVKYIDIEIYGDICLQYVHFATYNNKQNSSNIENKIQKLINDEVIFDGKTSNSYESIQVLDYDSFLLEFDIYIDNDNGDDFTIVRQMEAWNNKMSFDILRKGDYYTFAITNDGSTNKNIYVDKSNISTNSWHNFKIQLNNGILCVYVDGEYKAGADFGIKKLYSSNVPLIVGEGFKGKLRNMSISYE